MTASAPRLRHSPVVAVCLSDVHLSLTAPLARQEEPSWLAAMERTWQEVKDLAEQHGCPILCAGDVFDKWSAPSELVNWALDKLPVLHSIPGNHDLPGHSPELEHRGAYGTLVRAGKLVPLGARPTYVNELALYGTRLGRRIPRPVMTEGHTLCINVLLMHEYLWVPGCAFSHAPPEQRLGKQVRRFKGYDVIVVGDNHMGFLREFRDGSVVINTGTLMRRRSDEAAYRPSVGLIHRSGHVHRHYLDTSQDVFHATEHESKPEDHEVDPDVSHFLEELRALKGTRLDFRGAIKHYLARKGISAATRKVLLEALGDG
jgi:DNA repair exonuclease SbcCD nuclease subunit